MSDFMMPSMGADMDEGTLVEWKVRPGDKVGKGQIIASVDTTKVVLDIEVFESGVVEALYIDEGTKVDVGTPIARIGDGSHIEEGISAPSEKAEKSGPEKAEPEPEARADVAEKARPTEKPVPPVTSGRQPASPAARRKARERGIDLAGITGTGEGGAVVLADLESAEAKAKGKPAAGFNPDSMRQTIAAAMSRSKREIPHYYLATTVDLHAAEAWLEDYNQGKPPKERLLMAALLMKAAALALVKYPDLNGFYREQGFVAADTVNLGMAVNLRGGGLVAPAILGADSLALPALMARLQDLVSRARSGGLRSTEMSQGTATVTSLGERGVDTVYGVIYPPQVAMVGFGRVHRRPVVVDDAIAAHTAVNISLAADHRVCDGHLGALFLNYIEKLLQKPEAL